MAKGLSNEFGLQKLMLLNSAGYGHAVIPLDAPVSLVGQNNSGKTSLINAFQFLFIRNFNQMRFDSHEPSETKKFYFPTVCSYILLEMQLKKKLVVIGCVGKDISHNYEYFSYEGSLKMEDFITEDGSIVEESKLREHLSNRGYSPDIYRRPSDFFDALYGKGDLIKNGTDIQLFSVKHNLFETFQEVLVKTLNLKKLDSQDIKRFLLQINGITYEKEYDFNKVWHDSFESVEADKKQFNACKRLEKRIRTLETTANEVRRLRGKIGVIKPKIDEALEKWDEYKRDSLAKYKEQEIYWQKQIDFFANEHDRLFGRNRDIKSELQKLQNDDEKLSYLANQFAHVANRDVLFDIYNQKDILVSQKKTTLQNAQKGDVKSTQRRISNLTKEIKNLEKELSDGEKLFKKRISEFLDKNELEILFGLINQNILTFDANEIGDVPNFANYFKELFYRDELYIEINGLKIEKSKIRQELEKRDSEEIKKEIQTLNAELENAKELLTALVDRDQWIQELNDLASSLSEAKRNLDEFDEMQVLQKNKFERERIKEELNREFAENNNTDVKNKENAENARKEKDEIGKQKQKLLDDNEKIEKNKEQRIDDEPYFNNILEMEHTEYFGDDNVLSNLNTFLEAQKTDCINLKEKDDKISALLREFIEAGFVKYQGQGTRDEQIDSIVSFLNNIDQEELHIQKITREAIVKVSSVLRRLEHQYNDFCNELTTFNSLIQKRKVSDLDKMAVESTSLPALDAIKIFSKYSTDDVNSNDLFSLEIKNNSAGNAELDRAKDILLKVCSEKGCLKLENLFELNFIVCKKGGSPQEFKDLDKIASNGSILMAKLLYGLALLNLMTEDKDRVMSICYLDEAANLDSKNQKNLISSAREFGFNLVFASPEPQNSAKYCIGIERKGKYNYITEKQWQILEDLDNEERTVA